MKPNGRPEIGGLSLEAGRHIARLADRINELQDQLKTAKTLLLLFPEPVEKWCPNMEVYRPNEICEWVTKMSIALGCRLYPQTSDDGGFT